MTGFLKKFWRRNDGAVLIYTAILLPIFIGFIALGLDVASWHLDKRNTQTMADAAALAAAYKDASLDPQVLSVDPTVETAANDAALLNGFDAGAGETITVNKPPLFGDTVGNPDAIEVIIRTPLSLLLSALVNTDEKFASSRAVAGTSGGAFCILTLGGTEPAAFSISGTTDLSMNCGIAIKSTDDKAFKISGSADLDVTEICVEGGTQAGGNVDFLNAMPEDNCDTPDDPLANLDPPAEDSDTCTCLETDFKISGNGGIHSLAPGVYCNGIDISGNSNDIEFEPGEFILAGKGLKAAGGNNLIHGDGVVFYNTDNCGDEAFGDIDFSGNNTVNFSAPTSGPYAGVLFFNDRSVESTDAGKKFKLAGTVDSVFDGVVYYPNAEVQFSGTVNSENSCGVKIISEFLTLNGTSNIFSPQGEDCASSAISIGGGGGQIALVE